MYPDRRYLTFPASLLLAALLLMTLATTNLRLFFSLDYIDWRYSRLQKTGAMASEWPTAATAAPVLRFIDGDLGALPGLTKDESSHLIDVRAVRSAAYSSTLAGTTAILLMSLALITTIGRRGFTRLVHQAALMAAALLALALLVATIDFNLIFDSGHALVFATDTWLFDADTTLMRLFPPVFWRGAVSDLSFLTLIELAAITVFTSMLDRAPGERQAGD